MATAATSSRSIPLDILKPRIAFAISVLLLVLIGLVMVYSASFVEAIHEGESSTSYLWRQLVFALLGILFAWVLWKVIPVRWWKSNITYILVVIAFVLLAVTKLIGNVGLGAQRWVDIAGHGIQPSEFAKIAFIMMACKLWYDFKNGTTSPKVALGLTVLFLVVPIGLLYAWQSDLGTTLIILIGILAVLWLGELPGWIFFLLCLLGVVGLVAAIVMEPYRLARFFSNPWEDGAGGYGTGYQTIHSLYAFAEGGLFGVGIGGSHEKYLYLPEAETDFIFAVVGEEMGLFGAVAVIVLFLVMLYAGLRIARTATDEFGCMLAGSLSVMICFQAFLNILCVIGILPVTGKPLPFISSGGSSLVASLMMVGLVLGVSRDAELNAPLERHRGDLMVVHETRPADDMAGLASMPSPLAAFTARRGAKATADAGSQTSRSRRSSRDSDIGAAERPKRSETLAWGETFGLKPRRGSGSASRETSSGSGSARKRR